VTTEQSTFFRRNGYVSLGAVVPRSQLGPLREQILSRLKSNGITPSTIPKSIATLPTFQQITQLSSLVTIAGSSDKVTSKALLAAVDEVLPNRAASHQTQLLLSPPYQGPWRVLGSSWHSDISRSEAWDPAPVQAFVLIDDVDRHGGGTLLLAGSHHVGRDRRVEQRVRQALKRGDDGEAELRSLGLSVVELSGKAGDAYLMDMRVLHTPSINATPRLRMVATIRFFAG
jgi:hypothetical protein